MLKRFICIALCFIFLLGLCACGTVNTQPSFDKKAGSAPLSDKLIAENTTYKLEWNEENYGVILTNKLTGEIWGTSPEESDEIKLDAFGMPVKRHEMVNSVLSVYYRDKKNNTDNNNVYSYSGVVEKGHIRCARIKNGIHVEYFFDSQEFMIPVDFVLYEDYLGISVNPKQIQESSNIVTSVSIAPFLCSAENDSEDSYLFVPSGSGALVDTKSDSLQGKTFSAPVYGEDLSQEQLYDCEVETAVRMPVFGVKNKDKGIFAIIESAEESALIESVAGAEAYGYSSVYPTFQVRGYTEHQTKVFSSVIRTYIIYSDAMISEPMQIRFYPLSSGKSDYSQMAEVYRGYLNEKGFLKETNATNPLNLNLVGGSLITKSFLGIPYNTVQPATTIKQAAEIISDLSSAVDTKITVNLKGFGESGIDIGKIAGGYKVNKNIGNKSDLKKLAALSKEKGINLFMDFDLVNFSSSSNGFSTFFDDATNAGAQKVSQYVYDKATNTHKKSDIYYILSPWQFENATDKLIKKTEDFGLYGISLSSLTSLSYSDYSERDKNDYYAKVGFADSVIKSIDKISEKNKIMSSSANVYAAVISDCITDVPTNSSESLSFSEDIPFYQMVFKGYIPMFTESVNLSENPEEIILNAVESGCGLSYTAISKWDNSLIDSDYAYFYSSVYSDLKDTITENADRLSDYYEKIATAHIVSHKILENGIRKTEFNNGITVYVNYTDTPADTPYGTVKPLDYLIGEGA